MRNRPVRNEKRWRPGYEMTFEHIYWTKMGSVTHLVSVMAPHASLYGRDSHTAHGLLFRAPYKDTREQSNHIFGMDH